MTSDHLPGPATPDTGHRTIDCACSWKGDFSKAYSGLLIECPGCGKSHRIPTFETRDDDGIDMSTMKNLLRPYGEPETPAAPTPTVNFKPLFFMALAFALVVTAVAMPLLWGRWPVNAAVIGGALSWPLAIGVAWLGQRRHLRKFDSAAGSR